MLGNSYLYRWNVVEGKEEGIYWGWLRESGGDFRLWKIGPYSSPEETVIQLKELAKKELWKLFLSELERLVNDTTD